MTKLFNISEASNIALHSLALISVSNKSLNTNSLSEILNLSRNHIAKVLQTLTRYGIVSSGRGPKGGFTLLKDPREISIFEIYELIDGKIEAEHCRREEGFCPFETCVYGDERQRLYEEFRAYYSNRKLADLKIKVD